MSKPHIHFSCIQINEFPLVVGDTPSCQDGSPIELSWVRTRCIVVDIDSYEATRRDRRVGRRLILSKLQRMELLETNNALIDASSIKRRHHRKNRSRPSSPTSAPPHIRKRRGSEFGTRGVGFTRSRSNEEDRLQAVIDEIETKTNQITQRLNTVSVVLAARHQKINLPGSLSTGPGAAPSGFEPSH